MVNIVFELVELGWIRSSLFLAFLLSVCELLTTWQSIFIMSYHMVVYFYYELLTTWSQPVMVHIILVVYFGAFCCVIMQPARFLFVVEVKAHTGRCFHTGIVTPFNIVFVYQDPSWDMSTRVHIKNSQQIRNNHS